MPRCEEALGGRAFGFVGAASDGEEFGDLEGGCLHSATRGYAAGKGEAAFSGGSTGVFERGGSVDGAALGRCAWTGGYVDAAFEQSADA